MRAWRRSLASSLTVVFTASGLALFLSRTERSGQGPTPCVRGRSSYCTLCRYSDLQQCKNIATGRHFADRERLEMIPLGQPILVGHHSEKRHRRDLKRIDEHFAKAVVSRQKSFSEWVSTKSVWRSTAVSSAMHRSYLAGGRARLKIVRCQTGRVAGPQAHKR